MIRSIEPWSGARVGKQLRIRRGPLALGRVRDDGIKIWDGTRLLLVSTI